MHVIPCPRCQAQVVVPTGTPDAAVVRCPLCTAEYGLGEALTQALPALIIVSLPEAPALESADALPTASAASFAPQDAFGAAPSPFDEAPHHAPADPADTQGAPAPISLGTRPARLRFQRPTGGVVQAASVIVGGLMAIPLAQLVLWWLPADYRRDFGLGPTVARSSALRWLVPPEFRGDAGKPAPSGEPDVNHNSETEQAHNTPQPPPGAAKPADRPPNDSLKTASGNENNGFPEPAAPKKVHEDLPAVFRSETDGETATTPAKPTNTAPGNTLRITEKVPRAAMAQWYLAALAESDEQLAQELRWWPAGGRPVLALRWGVGVSFINLTSAPNVHDENTLDTYTIGLGPRLREQLLERIKAGAFGTQPAGADDLLTRIPVASNARTALVEWARGQGLDALVQIELETKVAPGTQARDLLAKIRLIDVDGAPSGRNVWFSNERLLKESLVQQPKNMQIYLNSVMAEVDGQFQLQPLGGVTPAQALARVEKVEPATGLAALRALAEVRYYQSHKLIDEAAAVGAYEKLLGEGKGQAFATGAPAQRKSLATAVAQERK